MHKTQNLKHILMAAIVLFVIAFMTSQTIAADIVIEGKIASSVQRISKNGNPYTILTVPIQRELNGIKYTTDLGVFCFKPELVKSLKAGDQVKMVAKHTTDKNGSEFTTLIAIVK